MYILIQRSWTKGQILLRNMIDDLCIHKCWLQKNLKLYSQAILICTNNVHTISMTYINTLLQIHMYFINVLLSMQHIMHGLCSSILKYSICCVQFNWKTFVGIACQCLFRVKVHKCIHLAINKRMVWVFLNFLVFFTFKIPIKVWPIHVQYTEFNFKFRIWSAAPDLASSVTDGHKLWIRSYFYISLGYVSIFSSNCMRHMTRVACLIYRYVKDTSVKTTKSLAQHAFSMFLLSRMWVSAFCECKKNVCIKSLQTLLVVVKDLYPHSMWLNRLSTSQGNSALPDRSCNFTELR